MDRYIVESMHNILTFDVCEQRLPGERIRWNIWGASGHFTMTRISDITAPLPPMVWSLGPLNKLISS